MQPFSPSSTLRRRAERLGDEFLAAVLRILLSSRPADTEILEELGHLLTGLGRYEEGLAIDLRLSELLPDNATVHYNLACSYALLGRPDEAFEALDRSVEKGYDKLEELLADEDLKSLRDDPRFRRLAEGLGGGEAEE